MSIIDNSAETPAAVAKAKAQSENRRWWAEKLDPRQFGSNSRTEVTLDLGQLHLAALRERAAKNAGLVDHQPATASIPAEAVNRLPGAVAYDEGINDAQQ